MIFEHLFGVFNNLKFREMAKDSQGRKFNRIPGYTKVVGGKKVKVKSHVRSNRADSKGQK